MNKLIKSAPALVFSAVLLATIFAQNPVPVFSRVRDLDRVGLLLPNWRFFAPNPANRDNHVLHRVLYTTGTQSKWIETHTVQDRRISHALWFPARRTDKGVFDVTADLSSVLQNDQTFVESTVPYRVLDAMVRMRISSTEDTTIVEGYQFMLASATGYDEASTVDKVLVSGFKSWTSEVSEKK